MLVNDCIEDLKKRRQNLLNGNINSIPTPFKRFENDFIGIERACYYCITSYTKGAKTQFSSFVFIFHSLLYAYEHPNLNININIFYFNLEETPEKIMNRLMSYLLFKYNNIRISPRDLLSTVNTKPVPTEILQLLETDKYKNVLEFFEKHIIFSSTSNPTGIYKECKDYAEKHGKTFTNEKEIIDEMGFPKKIKIFEKYQADDPNEYKLIYIDHIGLIDTEKGMSLKQSMDKLSEYLAKYLRNRYGFTPVVIQQQSVEAEGNDSVALNRIRPSYRGLGDSKYIGRDCNILLGLFSPERFDLKTYLGYDITIFKNNIRFLEVCINRDGEMGGLVALYFDGVTCNFEELPKPNNSVEIKKVYDYLNKIRGHEVFTKNIINFIYRIRKEFSSIH